MDIKTNFARRELKYILDPHQRYMVHEVLETRMVPDGWGNSTVRSIYYDTPTGLLARRSSEHPMYKEKIRLRSYKTLRNDEDVFLELKKKFDGMTYKHRATMPLDRAIEFMTGKVEPRTQIERELAFAQARYGTLIPSALVMYDRIALFDEEDSSVRITFDSNPRYRTEMMDLTVDDTFGVPLLPKNTTIMEVKCENAMPLWLAQGLSAIGLKTASFSKYCTAWKNEHVSLGMVRGRVAVPCETIREGTADSFQQHRNVLASCA